MSATFEPPAAPLRYRCFELLDGRWDGHWIIGDGLFDTMRIVPRETEASAVAWLEKGCRDLTGRRGMRVQ